MGSDLDRPHPDRRPRSSFAAPSRPFEPLVLVAALVALALHWLAISAANEMAVHPYQDEGLWLFVYRLRYLGAASAALGFLALLRIWWRGFTRQGLVLAFYTIAVSLWIAWLLAWWWPVRVPHERWFCETTALLEWLSFSLLGAGVLVHEGLRRRERRREPARPRAATRRLVAWLSLATALCVGAFLAAEGATRARVRDAYADHVPRSSTAEPPLSGFDLDNLFAGALTAGPEGAPALDSFESVVWRLREETSPKHDGWTHASLWASPEDVSEDELRPPSSRTEVARAYLEELDEMYRWEGAWSLGYEDAPIPDAVWPEERLRWREKSLFVALAPDRRIGELAALFDWARELRPEQSTVLLLCARSWPLDDLGLFLRGLRRLPLSAIPLELDAIPGATLLEARALDEALWEFEIGGATLEAAAGPLRGAADLARELDRRGATAVDLELATALPYRRLIELLDALRARGIDRVSLRPPGPQ